MRTRTTRNRRPSIGRSSVLEPTLELASLVRSRLARSRIARRAALRRLLAVGLALVVGWTVTGALEGEGQEMTHRGVVFSDKDMGHGSLFIYVLNI